MHPGTAEALRQLAADYWEGLLRRNPTLATFHGDFRYNDRLPDIGPQGRAEEQAELEQTLARLDAIGADFDSDEDRITADMLRLSIQSGLDALRLRVDEMAVDQMDGPQVWLPELLNWHPTDTPEHTEQLISRYLAFGTYMGQYLDCLSDGVREGRTAPTIAVERVIAQLVALLATAPTDSPLIGPARGSTGPIADQLQRAVADTVYPAYQRMLEFLQDYLEQHARHEPGVWSVTDGPEIYSILARQHTTTNLTPQELHDIGLLELERIHAEMRSIMQRLGDTTSSIRAFTEQLTHDASNLPNSREEVLETAEQLLSAANAALPRVVTRLPARPCMVKPVEDFRERDMPAAYYYPGTEDGSRPGTFYVNTFDPASRPRHTLPALAFHEGVPGHHLQIALAQETTNLPAFRRLSAGWLANAFVEGWALYTERLADELGLYPDDYARFGMLGYQAWRACRLVVDTGLHAMRWSRQQALEFFYDNVGLTQRETTNEVDRYIVWPGQALAYKAGQREIEAVRREQQTRLGGQFDLRQFHDALLAHGAVPLSSVRLLFTTR